MTTTTHFKTTQIPLLLPLLLECQITSYVKFEIEGIVYILPIFFLYRPVLGLASALSDTEFVSDF